ncbi:MAG: hypothetical protein KDB32_11540 [Planctomycetes bacterium]|nr:hypothetical protein [Planctomycetota bacterium]
MLKFLRLLPLLLVGAGVVVAAPEKEAPKPLEWKIEAYGVPSAAGGSVPLTGISQHGKGALMIVELPSGLDSIVYSTDGTPQSVTYPDGKPILGDFVYVTLAQRPAVIGISTFEPDETRYAVVTDTKAIEIVDVEHKPVTKDFVFRVEGDVVLARPFQDDESLGDALSVLTGNVLRPITDPNGKQLAGEMQYIFNQPNGRTMMLCSSSEGEGFDEESAYWLDGASATPVKLTAPPPAWKDPNSFNHNIFFKDYTLVIAEGAASAGIWICQDDKYQPLKDESGKSISHESMFAVVLDGTCYLMAADDYYDTQRSSVGHVYRVDGKTAKKLKVPEGKELGAPDMFSSHGVPVFIHESELSREEFWLIDGDELRPIITADKSAARAGRESTIQQAGGRVYIKYMTPKGYVWGRLNGAKLEEVCAAGRESWAPSCPFHEVGGELFLHSRTDDVETLQLVRDTKRLPLKINKEKTIQDWRVELACLDDAIYVVVEDAEFVTCAYKIHR